MCHEKKIGSICSEKKKRKKGKHFGISVKRVGLLIFKTNASGGTVDYTQTTSVTCI